MFNVFFKCAFCEIIWENVLDPDRPQTAMWRMRFACWISYATDTHTQNLKYVYLLLFLCSDGCMNASPGCVCSTLLLVFIVKWVSALSCRERWKTSIEPLWLAFDFCFGLQCPLNNPGPSTILRQVFLVAETFIFSLEFSTKCMGYLRSDMSRSAEPQYFGRPHVLKKNTLLLDTMKLSYWNNRNFYTEYCFLGARSCLSYCVTSLRVPGSVADSIIRIFHWHTPSTAPWPWDRLIL
jgi:hypothetical protein